MMPTPTLAALCLRLNELMGNLLVQIDSLSKRLDAEEVFILNPSLENIVDREKEKHKRRNQWRVTLHEQMGAAIADEEL